MLFSEPKIPQSSIFNPFTGVLACFSALQRAENSSMSASVNPTARHARPVSVLFSEPKIPQSAASYTTPHTTRVSVLFSEPKIPQYATDGNEIEPLESVSVLFSEPKIPQSICDGQAANVIFRFSALQRAENSSIHCRRQYAASSTSFQCSSASRKFLNPDPRTCVHPYFRPR